MHIIFVAQSSLIKPFLDIYYILREEKAITSASFYVSSKKDYDAVVNLHPDIENDVNFLKEWELMGGQKAPKPDNSILDKYDKKLGYGSLLSSLHSDRRIILGEGSTYQQNYEPRFSEEEMLGILTNSLPKIDNFLELNSPKLIVGFISVTFGEYLIYKLSKQKNIPYLNLRTSKIKNYVTFSDDLLDPISPFAENFANDNFKVNQDSLIVAKKHYEDVRSKKALYEGVIKTGDKPKIMKRKKKSIFQYLNNFTSNMGYYIKNRGQDNQLYNPIKVFYKTYLLQNFRALLLRKTLSPKYLNLAEIKEINFAFFPLHTEPEVSLMVRAPHCVNQIEVIRNIARSLPAGLKLLVKEHPVAIGKRKIGFYRKLLAIPNVKLVNPSVDAQDIISKSNMVFTINSSIGQDAVILGKPVICLGDVNYEILPTVLRLRTFQNMGEKVENYIKCFKSSEKLVIRYLATLIHQSSPVNLYSTILQKQGVFSNDKLDYDTEIKKLANLLKKCIETKEF